MTFRLQNNCNLLSSVLFDASGNDWFEWNNAKKKLCWVCSLGLESRDALKNDCTMASATLSLCSSQVEHRTSFDIYKWTNHLPQVIYELLCVLVGIIFFHDYHCQPVVDDCSSVEITAMLCHEFQWLWKPEDGKFIALFSRGASAVSNLITIRFNVRNRVRVVRNSGLYEVTVHSHNFP